jgi:hypothetical protein
LERVKMKRHMIRRRNKGGFLLPMIATGEKHIA